MFGVLFTYLYGLIGLGRPSVLDGVLFGHLHGGRHELPVRWLTEEAGKAAGTHHDVPWQRLLDLRQRILERYFDDNSEAILAATVVGENAWQRRDAEEDERDSSEFAEKREAAAWKARWLRFAVFGGAIGVVGFAVVSGFLGGGRAATQVKGT